MLTLFDLVLPAKESAHLSCYQTQTLLVGEIKSSRWLRAMRFPACTSGASLRLREA